MPTSRRSHSIFSVVYGFHVEIEIYFASGICQDPSISYHSFIYHVYLSAVCVESNAAGNNKNHRFTLTAHIACGSMMAHLMLGFCLVGFFILFVAFISQKKTLYIILDIEASLQLLVVNFVDCFGKFLYSLFNFSNV